MELQLIGYKPEYQPYFERFNKAWLEAYFTVEPLDKWVLENPDEAIIKKGGDIYFAQAGSAIIGAVALRFIKEGVFELTKMAVDEAYRGGGAGQFLCQAGINKAREMGVEKLILYSNRVLENAIHIYHKLGFVEIPLEPGTYGRANIMMEINFDNIPMQPIPLTQQEIEQFRAETKGTAQKIHFNNAGCSMPPDVVVDAVVNYLHEEAIMGGYEIEAKYQQQLDNTYVSIAKLINADLDEVAIVENASFAWSLAFHGIDFKPGDEIITCEMEYVTNLIGFLNVQKTYGVVTKIVPNDEQGNFSLAGLEAALTPQTKLIAVTQIASSTGGMIPIVEIGNIARKHNVLYLVDACQSAGQVPLDVKQIGCDMLSVTGRKYLRAPRGTGFLFVRKEIQDKLKLYFIDGSTANLNDDGTDYQVRNDARRFEMYEKNRALTVGLGKAIDYALAIGVDRIWQRIQYLANTLRNQLEAIDGITLHDFGAEQCGIVTFTVDGMESAAVKAKLAEKNINVSVGMARSTNIYMQKNHLSSIVRTSVHYYNTEDELNVLCNQLKGLI